MEHPTQPTSSLFKHPFASSRHPQESQTLETLGNFRLMMHLFLSNCLFFTDRQPPPPLPLMGVIVKNIMGPPPFNLAM